VFQRDLRDYHDVQPVQMYARTSMNPACRHRDIAYGFPLRYGWTTVNVPSSAINCLTVRRSRSYASWLSQHLDDPGLGEPHSSCRGPVVS